MEKIWPQIEALDLKVKTAVQQKMMLQIYYLIRRATRWFLRNRPRQIDIETTINHFAQPIAELIQKMPKLLTDIDRELLKNEVNELVKEGVPLALANYISSCNILFTSLDIVEAAIEHGVNVADVAKTYYSLSNCLELNWLREQMNAYPMANVWDELARSSFRDDLDRVQRILSVKVLAIEQANGRKIKNEETRLKVWQEQYEF